MKEIIEKLDEVFEKLNEELTSVEIWDANNKMWCGYDCPKGDTVMEYAEWCIGEHSEIWATVNRPDDKIRLNGWHVIDGAVHFKE